MNKQQLIEVIQTVLNGFDKKAFCGANPHHLRLSTKLKTLTATIQL